MGNTQPVEMSLNPGEIAPLTSEELDDMSERHSYWGTAPDKLRTTTSYGFQRRLLATIELWERRCRENDDIIHKMQERASELHDWGRVEFDFYDGWLDDVRTCANGLQLRVTEEAQRTGIPRRCLPAERIKAALTSVLVEKLP
jgi:hypothetical protein